MDRVLSLGSPELKSMEAVVINSTLDIRKGDYILGDKGGYVRVEEDPRPYLVGGYGGKPERTLINLTTASSRTGTRTKNRGVPVEVQPDADKWVRTIFRPT